MSIVSVLKKHGWSILMLLLIGAMAWFYWQMVDNAQMGFTHDDGVYTIAGKSLAQGKGFKLLHVVGEPSQVKYPFLFPLLLAPIWLINPHFPDNLPLTNALVVTFSVLSAGLMYWFFTRSCRLPGWLSVLIPVLVFTNFFCMYFSTIVMSEGPYLFFSFLTLIFLQRQTDRTHAWPLSSVLVAVLLSLITFYIRIPAISLMAATGFWLLFHRQFRNAFLYGGLCIVLGVIPWLLWTKTQTPPMTDLNYPLVNAYSNYGLEFFNNYLAAGSYVNGVQSAFLGLMAKMLSNMFPLIGDFPDIYPKLKDWLVWMGPISVLTMLTMVGYFTLQLVHATRQTFRGWRLQGDAFSIPALYLIFYMLLITLWNYEDQLKRFMVVVTPLLWMYYFKPALSFASLSVSRARYTPTALDGQGERAPSRIVSDDPEKHPRWKVAVLTVLVLFACSMEFWPALGAYRGINKARTAHWVESGKSRDWLWSEYLDSFDWIQKNTPEHAPLGVCSDVVYYLFTDRPTFYVFWASLKKRDGKFTADSDAILMRSLDDKGVKYLVAEPHMKARLVSIEGSNKVIGRLLSSFPKRFQRVYRSPRWSITVYKILPPTTH